MTTSVEYHHLNATLLKHSKLNDSAFCLLVEEEKGDVNKDTD